MGRIPLCGSRKLFPIGSNKVAPPARGTRCRWSQTLMALSAKVRGSGGEHPRMI